VGLVVTGIPKTEITESSSVRIGQYFWERSIRKPLARLDNVCNVQRKSFYNNSVSVRAPNGHGRIWIYRIAAIGSRFTYCVSRRARNSLFSHIPVIRTRFAKKKRKQSTFQQHGVFDFRFSFARLVRTYIRARCFRFRNILIFDFRLTLAIAAKFVTRVVISARQNKEKQNYRNYSDR